MAIAMESCAQSGTDAHSGISVLIACDGKEIWSYVSTVLEDCGFRVLSINEGRFGLNHVVEHRPDLIIVGEELSDISGLDWISKLRRHDRSVRIAFVADYWRETRYYQQLKKEFGVSLVIHRPFKPSIFALQIESLFGRAESQDSYHLLEQENFARYEGTKSRYARNLQARVQQLSEAMSSAHRNHRMVEEAMRLAHNMKSSARSCGFRLIGENAEQLERNLSNIINQIDVSNCWIAAARQLAAIVELAAAEAGKYGNESIPLSPDSDASHRTNVLIVSPELLVESLEKNLRLLHAENLDSALRIARKHPIDAALIDLSLHPRQNALHLADSIRELEGNQNLPLGFISSGGGGIDDHVEATRAGGSIFLERDSDSRAIYKAAEYLSNIRQGGRSRILLVDDDPDFSEIISTTLGAAGMLVRSINCPLKLVGALQEFNPELILLDVMMPMINGFDVCRQIRAMARWQDVPIIILTAHTGPNARINAFEAGADDYLPKPIIEMELLSRIRFRLERAKLIKERADKDVLTGLLSRRAFTDQVNALLAESQRHKFNFCIGFLDVDKFKMVNDRHGHLAGDQVLQGLGELLSRRFRVEDLRARWGGEEFALAFPHASSNVMRASLGRVLEEFRNITFDGEHSQPFRVTFSAGMSTFPSDGQSLKDLLRCADERLYVAKERGRNNIVSANEEEAHAHIACR